MNNIPKEFKIANMLYKVNTVEYLTDENNDPLFGQHDVVLSTITIALNVMNEDGTFTAIPKEQQLNTFWHELFHCFNYYMNNEQEEVLAQVFANFMREFESTAKF